MSCYRARRIAVSIRRAACALLAASILTAGVAAAGAGEYESHLNPSESERLFLDRLMMAESGGRASAASERSSALGSFQFLRNTFLDVARRNLPALTGGKSDAEILTLRENPKIARDVALIYTRENAAFLHAKGAPATTAYLRLAFFVGPAAALRVHSAPPETLLSAILRAPALEANPFLNGMTAGQLLQWSEEQAAGLSPFPLPEFSKDAAAPPGIKLQCDLHRASCRKWLALAKKRLGRREAKSGAS